MNNITKKIVAIVTGLTISLMMAGPALGGTAEDIAALQATIAALQVQLNAAVAQLAALQAPAAGVSAACTGITFDRNLAQTMSGNDVKCLQAILNQSADTQVAASGAGSPGNETTYFGSLTKAAVVKFQVKYAADCLTPLGLTAGTGFVGVKTRAKLNAILTAGGVVPPVVPTGAGLNVALAADTPAAATIVADNLPTAGTDGAQSLIPAVKVKFTNGDASSVKVTTVSFKRTGISADSDISQAYLYDGDTRLADYNSFSNGVLTFSNSAGLFTISAGGSKDVTLKFDLANGTASGKTIRFGIDAATNVVSDASVVKGTFPLTSNYMSTASTGDLGKLALATTTSAGATVDPQEGLEVFNFTLAGSDQKINVLKLKFTNIGSTAYTDLANFKLYDGGAQIGTTIASMASDKTVTFDLTASPIVIDKGITKNMHLKADIVGGTNRTFQFSVRSMIDVLAYDTQYGVYIKPNYANSWTVKDVPASTINYGRLTLTRASASPSGNVARDGTNVTIAKFDLKATGEEIKITDMIVSLYGSIGGNGLYQLKVYFDGAQKGTTIASSSSATVEGSSGRNTFSFGTTFIVPLGTKTLEIKADIKTGLGGQATADQNFTAQIYSTTAEGRTSVATIGSVSAAGYQLTIKTGVLSAAKNQAQADWTAANPMAVTGATEVLVGSFVVTAGAAEGADITAVKIGDDNLLAFGNLQNLKVYQGTKSTGVQIGSTQSSLATSSSYTFYPSPYISLAASQQITLNVYADIKTATSAANGGDVEVDEVDGTGKVTNTSANYTTVTHGQTHYIVAAGALTIAQDAATPKTAQLVAGTFNAEFTKVRFTAGAGEAISVTKVIVTATLGATTPTSTVKNISLWDGTALVGSTAASLSAAGTATFDLSSAPWSIAASAVKTLTITADVNTYQYATSGGSVYLGLASTTDGTLGVTYKGAVSGSLTYGPSSPINGNPMYTYKTKVTVTANPATPSGKTFNTSGITLMVFDVTNDGSYAAYLNNATVTIAYTAGTGFATTQANRTFYLYDYADLTVPIASTTVPTSTTISGLTFSPTLFGYAAGFEIPAGTKKIFALVGDLSDCGVPTTSAGSTIRFSLASGANFNWDDAVSTAIESAYTKSFPVYGGVLTF